VCEVVEIQGVDELTLRSIGVNLTGGHVNAVEICNRMYKMPSFDRLLGAYKQHLGLPVLEEEMTSVWADGGLHMAEEDDDDEEDED
jgi:hypothetical protein